MREVFKESLKTSKNCVFNTSLAYDFTDAEQGVTNAVNIFYPYPNACTQSIPL
jgi:hypothetical protein